MCLKLQVNGSIPEHNTVANATANKPQSDPMEYYNITLGYSSHTPMIELMKWAWLDSLHPNDVFDVILVQFQASTHSH